MASTIRDVAKHAGVSTATVSRTLRDPEIVSPSTRERVQRAVQELAFEPSHLGRQLAERRHAANGIVFPDLSGPYYAEVVLGYEEVAAELGRSVLILSTHGREGAAELVHRLAGRCDGLVVLGRTVADEVFERLAERGTPLVLLARAPLAGSDRSTRSTPRTPAAAAGAGRRTSPRPAPGPSRSSATRASPPTWPSASTACATAPPPTDSRSRCSRPTRWTRRPARRWPPS